MATCVLLIPILWRQFQQSIATILVVSSPKPQVDYSEQQPRTICKIRQQQREEWCQCTVASVTKPFVDV